jgi:hypothetical protein
MAWTALQRCPVSAADTHMQYNGSWQAPVSSILLLDRLKLCLQPSELFHRPSRYVQYPTQQTLPPLRPSCDVLGIGRLSFLRP